MSRRFWSNAQAAVVLAGVLAAWVFVPPGILRPLAVALLVAAMAFGS